MDSAHTHTHCMQVNKVDAKCHDLALTQERQREELLYRLVRLREAQVQKHLFPEVGGEAAHTQTNKLRKPTPQFSPRGNTGSRVGGGSLTCCKHLEPLTNNNNDQSQHNHSKLGRPPRQIHFTFQGRLRLRLLCGVDGDLGGLDDQWHSSCRSMPQQGSVLLWKQTW